MPGSLDQVALVDVVGADAELHEPLDEVALDVDAVVDPGQEDRLVAQRDACLGQLVAGPGQLRGHLLGMVDVDVQPERVVLLEHLAELVVDPLGQEDRHAGADPDDLDVGDLPEAAESRLEQLRRQGQAVTAGDEDVTDLRGPPDVVELRLELAPVEVLLGVADDPAPGAVAAVARALGRDQEQDPVGVAVDQPGDRAVAILRQRVLHHPGEGAQLRTDRDDLAADRIVRVVGVDEADEVRRDVDPELVRRREALALVVGQVQDLLELLERVEPVRQLPAPVVPLLVGDVLEDPGAPADRRSPVRAELAGGVAAVHERLRLDGRPVGRALGLLDVHARRLPAVPPARGPTTHKVYAVWMGLE